MNKNKALITTTIFGLGAAIYYILIFTLTKTFYPSFWVGFGFITMAIVITLLSVILSNSSSQQGKVTGLSLNTQSFLYLIFELMLGNALMWINVGFTWSFVPQVVCFLLFLMLYIPSVYNLFNVKEHNNKM